jgi:hypothetical protein
MTPSEFKAWFDGFTEAFTGCPTKAQWSRIKARVAEIDGKPVTERVYVDRYLPGLPVYPYYPYRHYLSGLGVGGLTAGQSMVSNATPAIPVTFNSAQAMGDLGRAEASGLAN